MSTQQWKHKLKLTLIQYRFHDYGRELHLPTAQVVKTKQGHHEPIN